MNGSLPPISRFTRATRSAQTAAIRLPVSTEPVKATHSIRSSATIAAPTSPAPATTLTTPAGRWSKQEAAARVESGRQLRGLGDGRVAGGERRRELPREQQQRVVPGDDAADRADRVLDHERQLARLDRGDHAAGGVAADLRVVVERGGGPADLVGVLDQRLAALERHQLGELVGARAQPRGHLVQHLAALDRRGALPAALSLGGGRDRGVELLVRGRADGRHGLLAERVLDRDLVALAGDALAADRQPGLDRAPSRPRLRAGLASPMIG